ncbi:PH domain-containing protein [Flavobacterium sp. MAH-1]|uniref:PH domain-containing protein n=1 Tax=Flavobacterium agri TaxID=2743471 RepID=A0A7Y8Y188_9FLAO|nr:PH domain-containing protein [Flavobacterium agri]NUY80664.1 PH domain-containing protein [Flavobacterium agri]NYA70688.1 PH domain-containing protein [Flavobacterium agri]
MKEQIKNFLNEEQDPKAVEKITSKLNDLLMRNEEVGYIGVQKKPVTVFPDSIVLTNKRIIMCKPKNLGLSMDFTDYAWEDIAGTFVKENILGSEFSFSTKTDIQVSIDYIPKAQARKIYTFAKEQLELLKEGPNPQSAQTFAQPEPIVAQPEPVIEVEEPEVEEVETEEVTNFAELIPAAQQLVNEVPQIEQAPAAAKSGEKPLSELSKDELFEKLQNYKRLLDNGLILQGEYDNLKKEILPFL